MFKKTLVALALTGFVGSAAAATIPQTAVNYSEEGMTAQTEFPISDMGNVVALAGIANGYQVGDKVVFTFPNDVFDISTTASIGESQDDGAAGTAPDLTFGNPVYSGGNSVSFTITAVAEPLLVADKLTLSGVVLEKANLLAGGEVKVDFKVISSVNSTDYEAKSATIAKVKSQFSVSVDKFDAVIDVNDSRKTFVDGADGDTDADLTDALVLTPVTASGGFVKAATVVKTAYTVKSDFLFMDTDSDGTADYGITVTGTDTESAKGFATGFQSYSVTDTTATPAAVTFTLEATDGTTVIPVSSFTADTVITYTAADSTTNVTKSFSATDAGQWTLNGASQSIAFLPFGSEYAQSITVTNTSTLAGEITVVLTADGREYTKVLTASAAANNVTNISLEVAALADESGITGNAQVQVIVNAPKDSVEVKGVYYHIATQDRVLTK